MVYSTYKCTPLCVGSLFTNKYLVQKTHGSTVILFLLLYTVPGTLCQVRKLIQSNHTNNKQEVSKKKKHQTNGNDDDNKHKNNNHNNDNDNDNDDNNSRKSFVVPAPEPAYIPTR